MRNRTFRRKQAKEEYRKKNRQRKNKISFVEFWRNKLLKEGK